MSDAVTIYALADPRKPALIRYIGKTKFRLQRRLRQHCREASRYRCPKNDWLRSLEKIGIIPIIWTLEVCAAQHWEERERYWIWLFRPMHALLNVADGGNTGPDQTGKRFPKATHCKRGHLLEGNNVRIRIRSGREQRICRLCKNLRSRKTKPHKFKTRAEFESFRTARLREMALAQRGTKMSLDHCAKLSKAFKGRVVTRETISKIRESNIENSPTRKSIQCIETGKVFRSIREAERFFGCKTNSNFARAIRLGIRCRGFSWKYV